MKGIERVAKRRSDCVWFGRLEVEEVVVVQEGEIVVAAAAVVA